MKKSDELSDPNSCLNRAADDEFIFVLRGHDIATPAAITAWIDERIELGKNGFNDQQICDAVHAIAQIYIYQLGEQHGRSKQKPATGAAL